MLAGDLDALLLHRDADQAFVLVHGPVGSVGEQADPLGLRAVRRPHFAAVDDVIPAVTACAGLDRSDVRAGTDLGYAQTRDVIAGNRRRQEFPPDLVGTEARERRGCHVGLNPDRHRHAAAMDVAELFGHHHGE